VWALSCALSARSAEDNGPVRRARPDAAIDPNRILVVWNTTTQSIKTAQVATHARESGTSISATRELTSRVQLLNLRSTSRAAGAAMLEKLRADPRVRYADYDHRRFAQALPNDPGFAQQWYLQATEASATHAQVAWDTSTGETGIVIADIDTGVRFDHPDLARATAAGKLLPGYDFVDADRPSGGFLAANDGNGRDPDPSDPGDWVNAADKAQPLFAACDVTPSSWHGTRTAGIIGALSNNGVGIAGTNWNSFVLPVRALGKCGGWDSDIIDAMRWAAGLTVLGAPPNPYPARIINMSLGATGDCILSPYPDVFNELSALGVVVVVSAGNEGGPVAVPANCEGAVAVTGLRHIGTKVGFSSLGPEVTIGAPGGNCVNTNGGPCLFSIDTLTDMGTTGPIGPGYTDQFNYNVGTSFSAPLVSGVASLMLGVNQNLRPFHVAARLRSGATTPFPRNADPAIPDCHVPVDANDNQAFECNCTTSTCGAGMLNAQGAMSEALRPIASVALPAAVTAGSNVSLGGSRSVASCGRSIVSYQWAVTAGTAVISNPTAADTTVPAPAPGSTTQVRLTVTDNMGASDTADVTITSTFAQSSVPTITPVNACPTPITVAQVGAPTETLSASPTSIMAGQSATLTWSSTDATSCTASGSWTGSKATSGSASTGALSATSTFTLVCNGLGGTSAPSSATVTVTPAATGGGGGGGGGGGALGLLSLFALSLLLAVTRRPVSA
jgi:serine protease